MTFQVEHIDHVEVFVRDLDAAVRWYGDVLGLIEVHRWEPEPIMIGAGRTMLALFRADPGMDPARRGQPDARPGWHRVAWRTDKAGFATAQRHLADHGIPCRGPIDHDVTWSVYFEDPDGNLLEITCPK